MNRRKLAVIAGLSVVALVATPGCVSKKLFRKNVDQTDGRVVGVETAVEANERRIADLSSETDARLANMKGSVEQAVEVGNTAMSAAQQASMKAEQAALGKLLWSVTLTDENVQFGFNDVNLSPGAMSTLDSLAQEVKSLGKAVYLEIQGHTDNIGSEAYNYELGEKRAHAALRYLNESCGIPLHAMNSISLGPSQPVADNGTRAGRQQNRRVVIRVLE